MSFSILFFLFFQQPGPDVETRILESIARVADSARVQQIGVEEEKLADPRASVAPGAPPILSFRYFAGAERHRFGNLDLVIDDAGH
jgi:hypothetical protein